MSSPTAPITTASPGATSSSPMSGTSGMLDAASAAPLVDPESPTSPGVVPSVSSASTTNAPAVPHRDAGIAVTPGGNGSAPAAGGVTHAHPRVNIVAIHPEHVTYEAVYKVVNSGALHRCYVAALKKHPQAQGGSPTLILDFENEKVTAAKIDDNMGLPELGSCVTSHLTGMSVPGAADPAHATAELLFSTD